MTNKNTEKFLKDIVAGFCCNSKLKIKKVSSKAIINSLYYQLNILEPIIEKEIPALLLLRCMWKKPSIHTSKSAATYLAMKKSQTELKYISFNLIPVII